MELKKLLLLEQAICQEEDLQFLRDIGAKFITYLWENLNEEKLARLFQVVS